MSSQPAGQAATGPPVLVAEAFWRHCTREWYPRMHSQTYFLPPIHFNKVPYDVQTVAGQSVLVPNAASNQPVQVPAYFPATGPPSQPPLSVPPPLAAGVWPLYSAVPPGELTKVQDSDVRSDSAMQRVLDYIRDLAEREQEVMLVISELDFRKYLDSQVDPITAAATLLLPRPSDLGPSSGRGDFDLLMINAKYGLIIGEIKAVGGADPSLLTSDLDKAVVKVTEKAVKQLNKSEAVLRHLVADLKAVRITKALMLPNVKSAELQQALGTNCRVQQDLCQCLGVATTDLPACVARCLCADGMTTSDWWQNTVTSQGPDSNMSPSLYETLVARFCGPATTVEIPSVFTPRRTVGLRTLSQAVALTGLTMATLTLYPQQVDLVNRLGLPRVFLWGPPGTGKTVVLTIKGLQWARQGKDIHLLSSHRDSRAAILLIQHQLEQSLLVGFKPAPTTGTTTTSSTALSTTLKTTTSTPATPTATSAPSTPTLTPAPPGPLVYAHFYDFKRNEDDVEAAVKVLASAARNGELYVIADEVIRGQDFDYTSGKFSEFCTNLVAQVPALHVWAAAMERDATPACMVEEKLTVPLRSPPVVIKQVMQSGYVEDGHVLPYSSSAAPAPTDGPAIRTLVHWLPGQFNDLFPGHTGNTPRDCRLCADAIADVMEELKVGQPGQDLQYRDTIILCQEKPRDDLPVVTSLRARGVPVRVVTSLDGDAAVRDMALAVHDAVTLTEWAAFSGLERRVVVIIGWGIDGFVDRLNALSRCTSLLVWAGGYYEDEDVDDTDVAVAGDGADDVAAAGDGGDVVAATNGDTAVAVATVEDHDGK